MNENLAYQYTSDSEPWREELIGGTWVAMAPAVTDHNRIKLNISSLFWSYLGDRECEVLPDGEAVFLTDNDYFIPDVMVVCDPDKVRKDGVHGAPDLVAEVLSPGTAKRDRGYKKDVYERSGVKEYWLLDPAGKSLEQYLLRDGKYHLENVYTIYPEWMKKRMKPQELAAIQTEFKCSLYDDLTIRLEDIFRRVP